jgi:hypothetical protein
MKGRPRFTSSQSRRSFLRSSATAAAFGGFTAGLGLPGLGTAQQAQWSLPYAGRFYGNALVGHQVADIRLSNDSNGVGVSFSFWADHDAEISHWRYQRRTGTGYSSGNPTYTVQIRRADPATNRPITTGSPVCQRVGYVPGNPSGNNQAFLTVEFTTKGSVTAGQYYCIYWINRGGGYVSTNTDAVYVADNDGDVITPPINGWSPARTPAGSLWFNYAITKGSSGLLSGRYGPILHEIGYNVPSAPGGIRWSGWGIWGGRSDNANYSWTITSSSHIRERFRVTRASRVVDGVWVYCWRLNNTGGSLVARLESGPASLTSGNGSTIESVTRAADNFYNAGASFNWNEITGGAPADKPHWVFFPFAQPRTLTLGNIYSIRLSGTGTGASFRTVRKPRAELQGLSPTNHSNNFDTYVSTRRVSWLVWEDSMGLQTSTNGGSTWTTPQFRTTAILFRCVT